MKTLNNIIIAVIALASIYFVVFFDQAHPVCPAIRLLLTLGGIASLYGDAIWFVFNNNLVDSTITK